MNRRKFLKGLLFAPLVVLIDNDDIPIRWRNPTNCEFEDKIKKLDWNLKTDVPIKKWHDYVINGEMVQNNKNMEESVINSILEEEGSYYENSDSDSQCEFAGLDNMIKIGFAPDIE